MKLRSLANRSVYAYACAAGLGLAASSAHGLTPVNYWSQRFGSTGNDFGNSVAADASGNVFVTGFFNGTVDFGGGNLVSAGNADIFVAKYNAAGVHQWSQRFGSTGSDVGTSVAADASGNVLVTGYFRNTVDFGGGDLASAGFWDVFVAEYNAAGVHQWSQRFGSIDDDRGYSVAADVPGNVFVSGSFRDTVNFGGGNLVSAGDEDIFLAKYDAAGVHQWSQRFGSTFADEGISIAVDASGNVVATGFFAGTVFFGGPDVLVSAGSSDIFLAKYDAAGVHQWCQSFGSTGSDVGLSVAADASANVLLTGYFMGGVSFGGGMALTSAGSADSFVAKYDAAGVHQWSQRFGSTSQDEGKSVAVDASGNVFLTGIFAETASFGGPGVLVSAGAHDIFLAKYDAGGAHQWGQRFGSTDGDLANSVAVDPSGNVVVAGYFVGTADFGRGDLVSAGAWEIFLAKYGEEPAISAITDIGNDQGRRVRIAFSRSTHDDSESPSPITQYEAYRRADAVPSAPTAASPDASSRESLLAVGWVFAGEVPAHEEDEYLMDAPTDADSTVALGQHYSVFFIRAATAAAGTYFDSPPDSGYSLDNLAPGVPLDLAYSAGQLTWDESAAADFDYFTVYGSDTDSFGAATIVDYSVAPAMDVTASPYVFYYVTATDFSGNEGAAAKVNMLTGVGGAPKHYVLSVTTYPNPFNPAATVSYTLPARGAVTVTIYSARGEKVATLVNKAEHPAGAYTIEWNGRADSGAAGSSGVYFVRIEQNGAVRSKKMVMLK